MTITQTPAQSAEMFAADIRASMLDITDSEPAATLAYHVAYSVALHNPTDAAYEDLASEVQSILDASPCQCTECNVHARCERCTAMFTASRAGARYCSDACRQAAYRDRRAH